MMRMSRIWETSPGSGVKSAGGAWEHATSSVASQGVANRRLTGSPRGQREPRYKAPSRTPTACIFPLLSFLMARSHGDCGVRTDRDAAGAGGAHPVPRAAPCAARDLEVGPRSTPARTGLNVVAPPDH